MHRVTVSSILSIRHRCLVYLSKCFTGKASPPGLHCTQGSSLSQGLSQNSLHEEEKQTMAPLQTSTRRNCLRTLSCLVIGRASSLSNGRSISSVAYSAVPSSSSKALDPPWHVPDISCLPHDSAAASVPQGPPQIVGGGLSWKTGNMMGVGRSWAQGWGQDGKVVERLAFPPPPPPPPPPPW